MQEKLASFCLCHFRCQLFAAQNVEMQVMHGLTGIGAAVGDHTVATGETLGSSDLGITVKI